MHVTAVRNMLAPICSTSIVVMADGHAKVSSTKMKIDNQNLAKTLADLVANDHNNSMNDVQSVEMEMSNNKTFRMQVMPTSSS